MCIQIFFIPELWRDDPPGCIHCVWLAPQRMIVKFVTVASMEHAILKEDCITECAYLMKCRLKWDNLVQPRLSVCVCVCMYVCIMYVCVCVCVCMYVCACACVCVHAYSCKGSFNQ